MARHSGHSKKTDASLTGESLRDRAHKLADTIPQQAFVANAGAALATLSFYGAAIARGVSAKIALVPLSFFLVGVIAALSFLVVTAIALKEEPRSPQGKRSESTWAPACAVALAAGSLGSFVIGASIGVFLLALL
jgi:hypothetical protein